MEKIFIDGVIGKGDIFSLATVDLSYVRNEVSKFKSAKEITLQINSGGGDVSEGFAIYDYLVAYSKETGAAINVEILGMCGSIATVISQVAKTAGGKVRIHANSEFFIHNPYVTPFGEPMEASDAAAVAEMLAKAEDKILSFYVKNSNKTADEIKQKMKMQTTFTAKEAVEWGFVDEIIGEDVKDCKKYQVMAFIPNIKNNNMNIVSEFEKFEKSIVAKIEGLLNPKPKAEIRTTSEGVDVYYDGVLEVGTAVFLDEAMTQPAPDGVHTVDGVQFEIKEGKVVSVSDAVASETEAEKALKAEVETLKAQLAAKEAEATNAITESNERKAKVSELTNAIIGIQNDYNAFRSKFITNENELTPEAQAFKGEKPKAKTLEQKILELRKNKK